MTKKIKIIKEIDSKVKIIDKSEEVSKEENLEQEVEQGEAIPFFATGNISAPVLETNIESAVEQAPAAEAEQAPTTRPREIERRDAVAYATKRNVFYETAGGQQQEQQQQAVYEDPMVKAARRIERANKPTGMLPEQNISPALAPSHTDITGSAPRSLLEERDNQYKRAEEGRTTRGSRKRYAWEV